MAKPVADSMAKATPVATEAETFAN